MPPDRFAEAPRGRQPGNRKAQRSCPTLPEERADAREHSKLLAPHYPVFELQPLDETAPGQSGRTSLPFTITDEKMVNLEIT